MTVDQIQTHLEKLGHELQKKQVTGEIILADGAVMLLVIKNRETTKDIDAYFTQEPQAIREAAAVVANEEGLPSDWINDGVKGFFYVPSPPTTVWAEYPGLRVYAATPEYLLSMKVVAGRPEDQGDIRALIAYLALTSAEDVLAIVARYVPPRLLTPRIQYLIEDVFDAE